MLSLQQDQDSVGCSLDGAFIGCQTEDLCLPAHARRWCRQKTKVANGRVFNLAIKLSQGDLPDQIMQVPPRAPQPPLFLPCMRSSCTARLRVLCSISPLKNPCQAAVWQAACLCGGSGTNCFQCRCAQVEVTRDLKNTFVLQHSAPASS